MCDRKCCGNCRHRNEGMGKPRTEGTVGCDKWHQIVDSDDICSDHEFEIKKINGYIGDPSEALCELMLQQPDINDAYEQYDHEEDNTDENGNVQ